MNNIEPGLIHKNRGCGAFLACPFCGREPGFSVRLQTWVDKDEKVLANYWGDDIPDDPAGFTLSVCCFHCTITMQECWCFTDTANKGRLLSSEYYLDKFGGLLFRWNRRQDALFTYPVKIMQSSTGENGTAVAEL